MGMYVCTQMRPYFLRMSVEHRFKHIVFAEAEVGEAEVRPLQRRRYRHH